MKRILDIDDNLFVRLFDNGTELSKEDKEKLEISVRNSLPIRPQGKWIEEVVPVGLVGRGNGQYRCSNCHHGDIQAKTQEVPFCWYCGAKMEKKETDNEIHIQDHI